MAPQQGTFNSHLADAQSWFQHAQSLEAEGRLPEAIAACQTALAAWPPVTPVHQMLWRLTQQTGKAGMTQSSLLHLLQEQPEDPVLNGEMGAELSKNGQFRAALPFLRIAAPALGDDRCAIWNYTAALAVEGAYQELIDAQPAARSSLRQSVDRLHTISASGRSKAGAADEPGNGYPGPGGSRAVAGLAGRWNCNDPSCARHRGRHAIQPDQVGPDDGALSLLHQPARASSPAHRGVGGDGRRRLGAMVRQLCRNA